MRTPKLFFRSTIDDLRYAEDRRGIPLIIRIWMYSAKLSMYLIFEVIFIGLELLGIKYNSFLPALLGALGAPIIYIIAFLMPPQHDLFMLIGFKMFKWMITQR